MYPDFKYVFEALLGTKMPAFFGIIKTFGFFVAIAFITAAYLLTKELRRKEEAGLLKPERLPYQKAKKFLPKEEEPILQSNLYPVFPHQRVGEIVVMALIGGLVGAKVFNALESWREFVNDPLGMLFSGSGLTFYGGLIVATGLIYRYCRKHNIGIAHFCDAIAPSLMLAYGIGRLGCHFSGDGDWGIFNSAYISQQDGSVKQALYEEYKTTVVNAAEYFNANFGGIDMIPHASVPAASGLPHWLYAMNFTHNVNNEGVLIQHCTGDYCRMLPVAAFPTSLYEAIICMVLFAVLWVARKKFKYALHLFGVYLILNGCERFFIEKIKVNYRYDWGFIHPAQSEIIAVLLSLLGTAILVFYKKKTVVTKV